MANSGRSTLREDPKWLRACSSRLPNWAIHDLREMSAAPRVIVGLLALGALAGWWVTNHDHQERFSVMEQRIGQLQDQNDQLKEQSKLQTADMSDGGVTLRWATPEELKGTYIRGVAVRVADLLDPAGAPVIQHRQFENCEIVGPAVFALLSGNKFNGGSFSGAPNDPESMLWPLPVDSVKVGAVGVADAAFDNCRFLGIGLAAPDAMLQKFRDDMRQGEAKRNSAK